MACKYCGDSHSMVWEPCAEVIASANPTVPPNAVPAGTRMTGVPLLQRLDELTLILCADHKLGRDASMKEIRALLQNVIKSDAAATSHGGTVGEPMTVAQATALVEQMNAAMERYSALWETAIRSLLPNAPNC